MWESFVEGLAQTGILAVDPATFKAASGMAIADWEIMNFSGIGQTQRLGTPIPSNVFAWADPMPDTTGTFYQRGSSLSDSYVTFLNSLSVSTADSQTIFQARGRASQFQMTDGVGNSWPGYAITPGLNDFLVASLQSVTLGKPPQIDFSVQVPASIGGASATVSQPVSADPPFFGVDRRPMIADQTAIAASASASDANAVGGAVSTIRFQAQTAEMFSIQPSRWFSADTVRLFHDHIDPASALANKPVFGPDGFLNGRASQILVAFKRLVTVSGQASLLDRIQSEVQQTMKTFNVGSFHFAADLGQTGIKRTALGTIIFQDNTNAPSVIGVTVEVFGP